MLTAHRTSRTRGNKGVTIAVVKLKKYFEAHYSLSVIFTRDKLIGLYCPVLGTILRNVGRRGGGDRADDPEMGSLASMSRLVLRFTEGRGGSFRGREINNFLGAGASVLVIAGPISREDL